MSQGDTKDALQCLWRLPLEGPWNIEGLSNLYRGVRDANYEAFQPVRIVIRHAIYQRAIYQRQTK